MDTRDALLRRVALAAPDARTHGQYQEDLLLCLSELHGPAVAEAVRGLVPEIVGPGSFNYRVVELLNLCDVAACTASGPSGLAYGDLLEQFGVFTARRFLQSSLGKAMWMMVPRDMHESLKWSMVSMRSALTYGLRRYEKLGPDTGRVVFQGELMGPSWMRGIFLSGLQVLTQKTSLSASIENLREPGLDFALRFTW